MAVMGSTLATLWPPRKIHFHDEPLVHLTGRDDAVTPGDDLVARRGAGRDLLVAVDEREARGAGLERALRAAIREGRLAPGTRLPSSRALAADLGWARGTVAGAYSQLVAEGWLAARAGAGTVVAAGAEAEHAAAPVAEVARTMRYDLRAGNPDVASFPRGAWAAAMRSMAARTRSLTASSGSPPGGGQSWGASSHARYGSPA